MILNVSHKMKPNAQIKDGAHLYGEIYRQQWLCFNNVMSLLSFKHRDCLQYGTTAVKTHIVTQQGKQLQAMQAKFIAKNCFWFNNYEKL